MTKLKAKVVRKKSKFGYAPRVEERTIKDMIDRDMVVGINAILASVSDERIVRG